MRKIISILIALGLVLSFSVMATPAASQSCAAIVTTTPDPACAGATTAYTVNLTAPVTLQPGDSFSFEFGAGTTFGTFADNDVTVKNGAGAAQGVLKTKLTVDGTTLWVEIPAACLTIFVGAEVIVVIPNVKNPGAGDYTLNLDYKESCCDPVVFDCGEYTIAPAVSTYMFVVDFSPTYPGLAEDFVPPFKACGQEGYGYHNTTDGFNYTAFNHTLMTDVLGCGGYSNVTIYFELMSAPTGGEVSLCLLDTTPTWHHWTLALTADPDDAKGTWGPPGGFPVAADYEETTEGRIHFNVPGGYEICFNATSPTAAPCQPAGSEVIADRCIEAEVHQWKDAGKIILREKWNLVSLPLVPFDNDIDALLASLPAEATDGDTVDELIRIDHYDRTGCPTGGTWLTHGNGQTSLTTMEDGKSYWVKISYPMVADNYTWWVWGTEKPMPPASPSEYPVCSGWNMFGHTSLTPTTVGGAGNYLWNWGTPDPVIYGWDNTGDWATSDWDLIAFPGGNLQSGQGYWGAFPAAGFIYVP